MNCIYINTYLYQIFYW